MVSVFLAVFAARRLKKVSFALRTATLTAVCCQEPLVLKKVQLPSPIYKDVLLSTRRLTSFVASNRLEIVGIP